MTRRYFINNAPTAKLTAGVTSGATTIPVDSIAGYPASFPYVASLGLGTISAETVLVTAASGTNLTVTRNYDGEGAFSHPSGETLDHVASAIDYDEANLHVNASAGVHGLSGTVVGTTDTQSLSNKTLVSPAISGTVSASSSDASFHNVTAAGTLAVTGNGTVSGTLTSSGALTAPSASVAGGVAAGSLSVSGASTLTGNITATTANLTCANLTAGTLAGILEPKQYTNEAAAGTFTDGAVVYLTAPTGGGPVGLFLRTGGAWVPLQTYFDTGWVTPTTAAVSGTPATVSTIKCRRAGNVVSLYATLILNTTIGSGNVVNKDLIKITDARFVPTGAPISQGLSSSENGPVCTFGIGPDGTIGIDATTAVQNSGDGFTVSGTYIV